MKNRKQRTREVNVSLRVSHSNAEFVLFKPNSPDQELNACLFLGALYDRDCHGLPPFRQKRPVHQRTPAKVSVNAPKLSCARTENVFLDQPEYAKKNRPKRRAVYTICQGAIDRKLFLLRKRNNVFRLMSLSHP